MTQHPARSRTPAPSTQHGPGTILAPCPSTASRTQPLNSRPGMGRGITLHDPRTWRGTLARTQHPADGPWARAFEHLDDGGVRPRDRAPFRIDPLAWQHVASSR